MKNALNALNSLTKLHADILFWYCNIELNILDSAIHQRDGSVISVYKTYQAKAKKYTMNK